VLAEGKSPGSCVYAYWQGLALDGTHWYYAPGVAAGAIPTNEGLSCVFVDMPPSRYHAEPAVALDALFQQRASECHPGLARALGGARRVGKYYSFAGRAGFLRQSWGDGWALVGDAGCFKDPITAHGITDALRDAELLARAVIRGTTEALPDYQAVRDSFALEFLELSDRIASFDWDLDSLGGLHRQLSRLMARECECVRDFDTLQTAREQVGVARDAVTQSEESLRIVQQRCDEELTTIAELLDSETALTTARTSLTRALYDARMSQARLDFSVGALDRARC